MISRVKGTQDFLDLSLYNFVINQMRAHVIIYHFTEIDTPILEPVELFQRALGTYTDVVSKEMFLIKSAEEEDAEQICLRPEATASVTRAFLEHHVQEKPWQVFSHGPMFRYERPQKGRYRQFHQINLEIIDAHSIAHDAQFITMLDRFFHEKLKLNNYALLINFLGCADDRSVYRDKLKTFLESPEAQAICKTCIERTDKNIMRIFDCKSEVCQQIYQKAPFIADNLCKTCALEWQQLQEQLSLLSISYAYNPKLVRGLDYYNKTVFEFTSENLGAQNAFCGAGRYELATQLGAKEPIPSIGAAIGIERLLLLLEPMRGQLPIAQPPALHVIMPLSSAQQSLALLLADTLHAHNLCTQTLLEDDSIKSMMRKANKMGAAYALILGDEEQEKKMVTVKHMITGEQEQVTQIELVRYLKK
jgi:histidyl-tRNA synthetase